MKCVVPGSYDPVTVGHIDIIKRAAFMFDEVYAVVFENSVKQGRFTDEMRFEMLRKSCEKIENVKVELSGVMLVDYMHSHDVPVVVKGARSASDFDYEYWLSTINRSFDSGIETVIIPSRAELQHISSTVVWELIKYGKALDGYVPAEALELIKKDLGSAGPLS